MDGGSGHGFVPPSTSFDKSRVLDIKPLRSLVPVFPNPPQAPPFVCSSPFGPFPPGFTPFYPFSAPQGLQSSPDMNQYKTPPAHFSRIPPHFHGAVNGDAEPSRDYDAQFPNDNSNMGGKHDGLFGDPKQAAPHLRASNSSRKKAKKSKDPGVSLSVDNGKGSAKNFVMAFSSLQMEDGNRELVNYILTTFDALRRRISQIEEAKESPGGGIKRADLKTGNVLMSRGIRTNMRKRIGVAPGVEVGDIFFFRMEMCLVGLHAQSMAGIDYMFVKGGLEDEPVAVSIVSSGGYDDDADDADVLIYTGQGGNVNRKDKQVADQKLERGNLALDRSSHRVNEVRVIRGVKDAVNPLSKVYVYDGLYTIQQSWTEKGKSGCNMFKYKLVRIPGQPGAFAHWKSIQKWKEGLSSRHGLILPDLTSGAESIPVSLVNDVDDEKGPAHFTYVPTLRYLKPYNFKHPSFGCNCQNACLPGDLNCSCIRKNRGDFPYTSNGILVSRRPLLHECGPSCPCFPNCKNRVSQTGLKVRLEVFKTNNRGWGLRSWDPIRAGTFICEYAGEVLDSVKVYQERDEVESNEYLFDTNRVYDDAFKWNHDPALLGEEPSAETNEHYDIPAPLIISAKYAGNVSRFMNHSCSPNVFWQPVLYEDNNECFLHIAFFAIKHIPPLTELTYDYGIVQSENYGLQSNHTPHGKRKCLCGLPNCKGYYG